MYPFSATIPANCIDVLWKKHHSQKDVELYVKDVEATFDLPEGILFTRYKGSDKPMKSYNGIPISEIRKAAVFNMIEKSTTRITYLSKYFGFRDHASILRIKEKGADHIKYGDLKFLSYYNVINKIAM